MSELQSRNPKAERIDRLLSTCMFLAVLIGVLQWAEGHYLRAALAGVIFLVVIPWLGRKQIERTTDRE